MLLPKQCSSPVYFSFSVSHSIWVVDWTPAYESQSRGPPGYQSCPLTAGRVLQWKGMVFSILGDEAQVGSRVPAQREHTSGTMRTRGNSGRRFPPSRCTLETGVWGRGVLLFTKPLKVLSTCFLCSWPLALCVIVTTDCFWYAPEGSRLYSFLYPLWGVPSRHLTSMRNHSKGTCLSPRGIWSSLKVLFCCTAMSSILFLSFFFSFFW